ncbi:MAG: TolB family protein [Phycisphaerales bacterium]
MAVLENTRQLMLIGCASTTLLLLQACGTGNLRHSHSETSRRGTATQNSTLQAGHSRQSIVTLDGAESIDFNTSIANTAISHAGRPTAIVGMHGESISHRPLSSGFGDGASNLAQITFGEEGEDFDPDVDPRGERIVFASTRHRLSSDLYMKATHGNAVTQLTSDPADDMMPEFSPDGQWIAFTSNRAGNWDVYIMPATGGQARSMTSDPEHEIHPSWSADGRQLVYCKFGEQSQRWELWTVSVGQAGARKFLDYGFLPEWSPDIASNKILFQRARERGSRYHSIWTLDYINGDSVNPTEIVSAANAAVINPSWAPDGRHIVFATVANPDLNHSDKPRESDLWLVNIDGSGRTRLTSGYEANYQPNWSTDGRIYFVSNRAGVDNLWSVSARWAVDTPWQDSDGKQRGAIANVPPQD